MAGCVLRIDKIEVSTPFLNDEESNEVVLSVSEADENFQYQVKEAIEYLNKYKAELLKLKKLNTHLELSLDFGVWLNISLAQCFAFPPVLVHMAGELNIGLEVSVYAASHS